MNKWSELNLISRKSSNELKLSDRGFIPEPGQYSNRTQKAWLLTGGGRKKVG